MDNLFLKKSNFIKRFTSHHPLRFHMSLILLATVCSGLLATRIMLALQLKNVVIRYPLAVVFAYLTFFIFVKIWLKYVVSFPAAPARRGTAGSTLDLLPNGSVSGSSGGGTKLGEGFRGGGGNFGGAGASGSFAEVDSALAESGAEVAASGLDAGGSVAEAAGGAAGEAASGLDLDDGCLVSVVLAAIAAVFLGVGIYLVYEAPFILSEAAFEAILAGGLVRGVRRISSGDWMGSVVRATWVPLTVTLLLALLAGYLMHRFFPGVTRLSELWGHF